MSDNPNIIPRNPDGTMWAGPVGLDVSSLAAGDAFGRLRVSSPLSLHASQHQYDVSPQTWGSILTGGGTVTHVPAMSAVQLAVAGGATDAVRFQTRQYVRYQPGKSQLILASFVLGAPVASVLRRVGYYDDANGVFFEQNGTVDVAVVVRSSTSGSVVNNRIAQAQWNLDKLDGTGTSGITLDLTKAQLLVIDLQWLSVGRVRVGFQFGGQIVYCHQFLHANAIVTPYMTTANLPIRYSMQCAGATTAATMLAICAAVSSEGGRDPFGYIRTCDTGAGAARSIGTTRTPLLAIRPKATFNSIANRGLIYPLQAVLFASADVHWELFYTPTLTGASFTSAGNTSIVDFDVAATTMTNGDLVASGYKGTGAGFVLEAVDLEKQVLCIEPDGSVAASFVLAVTSLGGNVSCRGAMQWREER